MKIAVIGGGVAGMSFAHELMRRSTSSHPFEIDVYERNPVTTGGKARTIPVPNSATGGRADLPGEHGFRFFPGFYRHLPDTMSDIPFGGGTNTAANLVVADRLEIARFDKSPIIISSRFPRTLSDLLTDLEAMFGDDTGLEPGEISLFAKRLWQVISSCQERRLAEYEKITWWDFLEADQHSEAYRRLLVEGLSRSLLANDPRYASLRTVADTNIQLMLGMTEPGKAADRLLNGPTSKVWIDPWRAYLENEGVKFHLGNTATQINFNGASVSSVTLQSGEGTQQIEAEIFVFCLPVERMAALLAASGEGAMTLDPSFANIAKLSSNVRWMNGIQYFMYDDVPIVHGHMLFADTPWAIAGISEAQFWSEEHLPQCGDGTVNGVLSVCISEWDKVGIVYGKPAIQCTRDEIAAEVWAQIKRSVNVDGKLLLEDRNLHSWFLDPDIVDVPEGNGVHITDAEPLFVNFINSWDLRPQASIGISNMLLASDYVQTYTDVACMEAANEAARRAVNAVLVLSGSKAAPCALWELHEPAIFAPFRWHDKRRFDNNLPWDGHI